MHLCLGLIFDIVKQPGSFLGNLLRRLSFALLLLSLHLSGVDNTLRTTMSGSRTNIPF